MTDTQAPVETTPTPTTEVSKPLVSPKPYDDDLLEVYEAEAKAEATPQEEVPQPEVVKEETPKEEETEVPPEKTEAKSKEGDKVDDGFENVPVKRLINGKEVEFKIKDAIEAYVAKEDFNRKMDQRITHITQRERAWAQDQNQFKDRVNKVIEVAQKGDFVTAIKALAKVAVGNTGLDVTEFEKAYFEQLDKVRDVYTKLTPEQREAYFAKRAAQEAKAEAEALKTEKTINSQKTALETQVKSLQEAHGVAEQEFWGTYKLMEENLVGPDKPLKDVSQITPEGVIQMALQTRHESKVLEAGKKLGVTDDAILTEVSRITSVNPSLTVEDITKVIESSGLLKTAAPAAVENLNRKAGKSNTRFSQGSSTKKENGKIEGYDEETLNELYRKAPRVYARPVR